MRPVIIAVLASAVAFGCGPRCEVPDRPRLYLVQALELSQDVPFGSAYGLDLDGMASTGEGRDCVSQVPDWRSLTRGDPGVDNQLMGETAGLIAMTQYAPDWEPEILAADARSIDLAPLFARGVMVMAIEWAPVDPMTVRIAIHQVEIDGDIALAAGRLAPGQHVRSIRELAETTRTIDEIRRARCWISAEVEAFAPSGDPSPLLSFDLARFTHLGAHVTEAGELDALELGGSLAPDDFATWVDRIDLPPTPTFLGIDRDEVRATFATLADIASSPDEPRVCDRVSFGLRAALVPAEWAAP